MRPLLISLAVLGAFAGRYCLAADEPADAERIRGQWLLVSSIKGATETKAAKPDDDSENLPLAVTFDESTWKTKIGPKGAPIELGGGYVLDPTQTPKLLDVTLRNDNSSSDLYLIYKFEKDRLYLRLKEGNQRPIDFDTQSEDCTTLIFRKEGP